MKSFNIGHVPSTASSNWVVVYESLTTHWRSLCLQSSLLRLHQQHRNLIICQTYSVKMEKTEPLCQSQLNVCIQTLQSWTPPHHFCGISFAKIPENNLWIWTRRLIVRWASLCFRKCLRRGKQVRKLLQLLCVNGGFVLKSPQSYSPHGWRFCPRHLFAVSLVCVQMKKALYYSIFLKMEPFFCQTELSCTLLINAVVLV